MLGEHYKSLVFVLSRAWVRKKFWFPITNRNSDLRIRRSEGARFDSPRGIEPHTFTFRAPKVWGSIPHGESHLRPTDSTLRRCEVRFPKENQKFLFVSLVAWRIRSSLSIFFFFFLFFFTSTKLAIFLILLMREVPGSWSTNFSRVLPTSFIMFTDVTSSFEVGYYAGEPIESAVHLLNIYLWKACNLL